VGLGRESEHGPRAPAGLSTGWPISAVGWDPTVARRFRDDKKPARNPPVETLSSFPLPFLCLTRSRSGRMAFAGGEEGRRREPPRRRACSPAAEHAAVERLHGRCLAPARSSTKPAATEGSPAGFLTAGGGYCSGEVGDSSPPFSIRICLCSLICTG
jgi:hypothetical protein